MNSNSSGGYQPTTKAGAKKRPVPVGSASQQPKDSSSLRLGGVGIRNKGPANTSVEGEQIKGHPNQIGAGPVRKIPANNIKYNNKGAVVVTEKDRRLADIKNLSAAMSSLPPETGNVVVYQPEKEEKKAPVAESIYTHADSAPIQPPVA